MKTTVITGAASGIGAAVKQQLEAAGHKVISVDRQQADVVADLSTAAGRDTAVGEILKYTDHIDGLVCCAGVGVTAPNSAVIIEVNYFGAVDLINGLKSRLQQAEQPAITVIGSFAASQQLANPDALSQALISNNADLAHQLLADIQGPHVAYSASKYALTVFCRQQALEFGQQGIRLNVVAPGAVATPLHQASLEDPKFGQAVKNFVAPLGAHTDAEQIAKSVVFLQSADASFIHGSVLFVDGGMDAMLRPNSF
ncbi:SDR family oxidoreductase [Thalassotalea ponticola]|uniref:SDR family oxidoreductase n=1 Tax=Thalassotalea ponticola TaxID=1523392 RepID=UPI0025B4B9D4|nr:SDR family oxidoreductase [Thalassotalea ponticola]MDN3653804.1 SDR family oxidoreductase [Thalassotalea ponticola]